MADNPIDPQNLDLYKKIYLSGKMDQLNPVGQASLKAMAQKYQWDPQPPSFLDKVGDQVGQGASRFMSNIVGGISSLAGMAGDVGKMVNPLSSEEDFKKGGQDLYSKTLAPSVPDLKDSWENLKEGNLGQSAAHLVRAIPIAGQMGHQIYQEGKKGEWGNAIGDLLSLKGGPEGIGKVMEGVGKGGRLLGEGMVSSSQKRLSQIAGEEVSKVPGGAETTSWMDPSTFSPNPGPTPWEEISGRVKALDIYPKYGRDANGDLGKVMKQSAEATRQRDALLNSHTDPIPAKGMVDSAYDYVKLLRDKLEPSAEGATSYLSRKVEDFTGIKRKSTPNSQGGVDLEDPWHHINRSLLEDKGKTAKEWHQDKNSLQDIQKPTEAVKSHGEVLEGNVGSDSSVRDLLIHDLRSGVDGAVGSDYSTFNRTISQNIGIQKAIRQMAKDHPDSLLDAAKYVMGGAAGGLTGEVASHFLPGSGGGIMSAHTPIGISMGLAIAMTKKLIADPIARARMGDWLRQKGPTSGFVEGAARLGGRSNGLAPQPTMLGN